MTADLPFAEDRARREDEPALVVDVDGYEGPLDLLLDLARRQKVDLHRISILALAEQYLVFVEQARALRLELAADYLVMAAWLAYLKSRLLLPEPPRGEEPSAADLATALALRLRRLEAIRAAANKLSARERLGQDVFARGAPEEIVAGARPVWEAELYDLLAAYAHQRQKRVQGHISVGHRVVWSLVEAREALQKLVGEAGDWTDIDPYLTRYMQAHGLPVGEMRATVRASALSAMLEMVREGMLDIRQDDAFAPIHVRRRSARPPALPFVGQDAS
ncbi:segregation/condensation protein A [Bosea sp. SSUT16]|jgi:segregation and condensation protein A|uniref:Segregation and condensation protein A n=2 Tax=Pseudomonadota TaxID=1224 RepID=A0A927I1I1_9HYPH|nr:MULTISPECIES: ScpA family protein [Bosea]MBD3846433.1 segregation/condensation protein A [Bosea spartocytisi]MCT4471979.1 segregation/condensation protein A [Bosea spartocytisi]